MYPANPRGCVRGFDPTPERSCLRRTRCSRVEAARTKPTSCAPDVRATSGLGERGSGEASDRQLRFVAVTGPEARAVALDDGNL
jgi:hypothetical protein